LNTNSRPSKLVGYCGINIDLINVLAHFSNSYSFPLGYDRYHIAQIRSELRNNLHIWYKLANLCRPLREYAKGLSLIRMFQQSDTIHRLLFENHSGFLRLHDHKYERDLPCEKGVYIFFTDASLDRAGFFELKDNIQYNPISTPAKRFSSSNIAELNALFLAISSRSFEKISRTTVFCDNSTVVSAINKRRILNVNFHNVKFRRLTFLAFS